MRKSEFTIDQIHQALIHLQNGRKASEIANEMKVTIATIYLWKKKYPLQIEEDTRRVHQLEKENTQLKSLVLEMAISNKNLRDQLNNQSLIA